MPITPESVYQVLSVHDGWMTGERQAKRLQVQARSGACGNRVTLARQWAVFTFRYGRELSPASIRPDFRKAVAGAVEREERKSAPARS
jgi:hypothetical protein